MSEWPQVSLGESGVTVIDCEHSTPPSATSGYPYVAIPQMREGRLDFSTARRISQQDYVAWTRKAMPRENDVVLSRRCNPGESAYVPPDAEFAVGQNLLLLRSDGSNMYPPFLRWIVRGPEWWAQVGKYINVGAVFDSLRLPDIPNFVVHLPPLNEQRAIAATLRAIDDKIESNGRLWQARHDLAAALYQRWAREAADSRSLDTFMSLGLSGVWGENEPSGKSPLPVSCLRGRDLEDLVDGRLSDAPTRYVSSRQIDARRVGDGEIWTAGSGSLGPSLLLTAELARRFTHPVSYSNFVKRLIPVGPAVASATAWHAMLATWRSVGFGAFRTGTAMPNLDANALLTGLQVPVLSDAGLRAVDEATRVALDPQPLIETDALTALRDALIPELLSGRLRVPEAREQIDAAV